MDFSKIRTRLANSNSEAMWRSLEELCDAPEFRASIEREFPGGVDGWSREDGPTRRRFLQLIGASLMLAGASSITGCSDKPEDARIVPYVEAPEQVVPGKPMFFATAMPWDGYGRGVLVSSREGRPIKVEGNPDHPASLGGADALMQASILGLYDPDRSKAVTCGGAVSTWGAFLDLARGRLRQEETAAGEGIRVLIGTVTSPTLSAQLDELRRRFPRLRLHRWTAVGRTNTTAGTKAAFGRPLAVRYDFAAAKVVVSLDSDFLFADPGSLRYARQFIDGRRVRKDRPNMNRLYVIEGALTLTGSMADHRLAVRPSTIRDLAAALAAACGTSGASPTRSGVHGQWVREMAADLSAHRGACLIVVGESQPPELHALAHLINHTLGNVGRTVTYSDPVEYGAADNAVSSLSELTADMHAGQVDTLLILGGNPAYDAPADVPFAEELARLSTARAADGSFANLTAHLSDHDDETTFGCQWHLPEAHYLESWGDVRAFDGTASILQPLIAPLYGGRSASELIEALLGRPDRSGYEIVRSRWATQQPAVDFETWWQRSLASGIVADSASPSIGVGSPRIPATAAAQATTRPASGELELVLQPDYSVWDGRYANNAWLQELPKPFTKLTWDNAALVSPKTAESRSLQDGDVVTLNVRGHKVEAPVMVTPGIPDGVVCVSLGYGRTRAGHVGTVHGDQPTGVGFNAYAVRPSDAPWFVTGVTIETVGRTHRLVTTRSHHAMGTLDDAHRVIKRAALRPNAVVTESTPEETRETANRRLVRVGTLDEFKRNPQFVNDLGGKKEKKPLLSLYPGPEHGGWDYSTGYQWGMSIDINACIGCNACVVACQSENNIPVVGKEEVARQREMHWLRVDDYYGGSVDDPKVYHQPVPCMHCENAPCEYVCPVGATTHSAEGLNQMTYNRCVGTRYCSNNCPYKVRRFNFLGYADAETTEPRQLQRNPDVTVRTNGVMEKCTYCVQRLQRTRIEAERMILDAQERGDPAEQIAHAERSLIERLQTACQQSCPTRAIEFGSINPVGGEQTRVAKVKSEPLDYSLLHELTTRPRTTYMARLRNPNPALEPSGGDGGAA